MAKHEFKGIWKTIFNKENTNCTTNKKIENDFKQKIIEKFKENKINFDTEKANYIDDNFDSVLEAIYEVHEKEKLIMVYVNSIGGSV